MAKRKKRILLVEDDVEIRRLYALGLNNHGFEVKLAANGAEAVDRLHELSPDVILLDLGLPLMTGWEVIDKFGPTGSTPPIVVISGERRPDHDDPRIHAWLSKPVTVGEIVAAIGEVIDVNASSPKRQKAYR